MTFYQVCNFLCQEPFHLTIEDISKLNPFQIHNVFLFDKDKDYWLGTKDKKESTGYSGPLTADTYKVLFWQIWKEWRNYSEEEVQKMWEEHEAKEKQKKV